MSGCTVYGLGLRVDSGCMGFQTYGVYLKAADAQNKPQVVVSIFFSIISSHPL